jgi:hypothetical protein
LDEKAKISTEKDYMKSKRKQPGNNPLAAG